MGDGDGTAVSDLLAEEWDNRAVRTQNIAKACGNKLCDGLEIGREM